MSECSDGSRHRCTKHQVCGRSWPWGGAALAPPVRWKVVHGSSNVWLIGTCFVVQALYWVDLSGVYCFQPFQIQAWVLDGCVWLFLKRFASRRRFSVVYDGFGSFDKGRSCFVG